MNLVRQVDLTDAEKRSKELGWQVKMMAGGGGAAGEAGTQQAAGEAGGAVTQVSCLSRGQ